MASSATGPRDALMEEEILDNAIAVIGMAGQFPGANSLDQYWKNLAQGLESISFFSDSDLNKAGVDEKIYSRSNYVRAKGIIDRPDYFDANFFGYSTSEALYLDPQQRLFLESAWEALEHAGYCGEQSKNSIGVFASTGFSSYLIASQLNLGAIDSEQLYQLLLGNDKDYLSTRVSYKLNLTGPSINVQTACSSSLVCVHMACQSLLNGECDIALAGGVSLSFPHTTGYQHVEGMILSPDGHCRAFDAKASGTLEGNGVGIVVLRPLAEALAEKDTIHAIIRSSAINNDGAQKVGYTSPSIDQQSAVVNEALNLANITTDDLSYIETHGTGTPLGDPIEIAALSQVFNQGNPSRNPCILGAVKTNIGHLNTASGIAGLLKTILALKHESIPATLHFQEPNPKLNLDKKPFKINTTALSWKRNVSPRIAGVSSFGIGGTNAHVIVQESPIPLAKNHSLRKKYLLLVSAKSSSALEQTTHNFIHFLRQNTDYDLADIAYTSQVGRKYFDYRGAIACSSKAEAIHKLEQFSQHAFSRAAQNASNFVWLFPGQGSQYKAMASQLYKEEAVFQKYVNTCCSLFDKKLSISLRDLLFSGQQDLIDTSQAQPALFTIEYALAMTLLEWGLKPNAVIGHSLGEYTAACIAGVFSLQDAVTLISTRCRLMQQCPQGAMLSVAASEATLESMLFDGITISAVNSTQSCVVAGETQAINQFQQLLETRHIACKRLHTSHAFHSALMEPMLHDFHEVLIKIQLSTPKIPIVCNLKGDWLSKEQALDPNYWIAQLRQPVLFAQAINTVSKSKPTIFLEIGPGHSLGSLVKQNLAEQPRCSTFATLPHPLDKEDDHLFFLNTLGQLWMCGITINFAAYADKEQCARVPLPTYPFEKQLYTLLPHQRSQAMEQYPSIQPGSTSHHRTFLATPYVAPTNELEEILATFWQDLFLMSPIGIKDHFFELGGNSLLGIQLLGKIRSTFQVDLSIQAVFENPTIQQISQCIISGIESLPDEQLGSIYQ